MSLYLSQLILDARSRQVQAELRAPYQMHRTLSKAFGDEQGAWAEARVLFRVDEDDDGKLSALVQSKTLPNWSRLTVADGYLVADPDMKEYDPAVRSGQVLRFRLRANPTARRIIDETVRDKDGRPKRGRVGLFGDEQQMKWLRGKAEKGGFKIVECRISATENTVSSKLGLNGRIVHLGVTFDGILAVTEADLFRSTLESGIGSGKGFGFGLLSVAPYRG